MKHRSVVAAALAAALALALAPALTGCAAQAEAAKVEGPRTEPAPGGPAGGSRDAAAAEPAEKARAGDSSAGSRVELALGGESGGGFAAATAPSAPPPVPRGSAALESRAAAPAASGLKAGFADDNRQFNYFVQFLDTYGAQVEHRPIPIGERLVLKVADSNGRSVPNAQVRVIAGGGVAAQGLTYADGTFAFFPLEHSADLTRYRVEVTSGGRTRALDVDRQGPRTVTVGLDRPRAPFQQVPLDILFVLDTTGSMGEEIERLKTTIELINLNLASLSSKPRLRFGMVLYKDRRDEEYLTRVVPLTGSLEEFQSALAGVNAAGGGDTPEDLEAALAQAVEGVQWNNDGIRLAFVITDAPAHLDEYAPEYTYVDAVHDARRQGIKFFSVGTGGLPLEGEVLLRQVAQYTGGKYIFLTYGERGESQGGEPGSVSHHTGDNYQTDKLETIIVRLAREELAHLSDQPPDQGEDFFQATRIAGEEKDDTLGKLFEMALGQLVDFSSVRIEAGSRTATLPLVPASDALRLDAEYFSDALAQALSRSPTLKMVERRDLQKVLEELQLQLSGLVDEGNAARVGRILGAEMLLSGTVYRRADSFEVFLKLLRVETGEVLAVTKARLDARLGLSG